MTTQPEWITVGALADGFAPEAFTLPNLTDLAGKTFTLHFANGWRIEHRFGAEQLAWTMQDGSSGEADYRATSVREGLYLVDFLKHEGERTLSVSLVLDIAQGAFTAVIGQMPSEAECRGDLFSKAIDGRELTSVQVEFFHGSLDLPFTEACCPHAPTRELVGLRNLYRYSPTEIYEHLYLNENFYSWQCLRGVEQGLADTDRCHTLKIAESLYLFVWREKIIPTLGVVLIDLQNHRSDGKICGYADGDFGQLSNFPVSSHCSVLNRTEYPL